MEPVAMPHTKAARALVCLCGIFMLIAAALEGLDSGFLDWLAF